MVEGQNGLLADCIGRHMPALETVAAPPALTGRGAGDAVLGRRARNFARSTTAEFASESQKEITNNEALVVIDAWCGCVEGMAADPGRGKCRCRQAWIVGPSPVSLLAYHATAMDVFTAGGWRFAPPAVKMRVFGTDQRHRSDLWWHYVDNAGRGLRPCRRRHRLYPGTVDGGSAAVGAARPGIDQRYTIDLMGIMGL